MDDAVGPLDAPEGPDGTGDNTADGDVMPVGDPVAAYAPPPREEAAPRLDLERDPFAPAAPAYPVLDPEPAVSVIEPTPAPALFPTVAEEVEASAEEAAPEAPAEDAAPTAPAEDAAPATAAEEPPASDGFDAVVAGFAAAAAAEPAEPVDAGQADVSELSLDEMVGDLETAEEVSEPAADGSEASAEGEEPVEGEEPPEGETALEESEVPESWREAAAASEATAAVVPELARDRLSTRLPFWLYGATWAIFVGTLTYLIWPLSDKPFVDAQYYAYLVYGGAAMLVVGLVLAIVVWIVARIGTTPVERAGLGRAICLRAAGWMAVGVIMWWAGMYALDMHRLGLIG